jgi:predicted  nucleic acid-binding Zn-ribbon protein
MTPEQRWEKIEQTLAYVTTLHRSHDEQIGKLVEQSDRNERLIGALAERMGGLAERMDGLTQRMDVLTQRTIQAMDAINRLGNIAMSHEDRIDSLEKGLH